MKEGHITEEKNESIDVIEENQIKPKENISSTIITNPFSTINLPYDGAVDLNSFERILDEKLSSSYKIFWFFGIFKEILNENKIITFRRLVCRMIIGAWYPVTQYKLNLGIQDRLYDLVMLIHRKYNIPCDEKEENLLELLESINDVEVESRIKSLHEYVPYRLLSPFYSRELADTRDIFGKNDSKRHKFIGELTKQDDRAIYRIDTSNKSIEINDLWYRYIRINQNIIYGWMHYKLVCYLQKRNPNVPAIPFKITAPVKRDLSKAKKLWKEINKDKAISDIYTGKILTQENFSIHGELSIDHFIPWSFVLHDELWNLVPTFKNINSGKSNKLPSLDLYLDKFCEVQYESFDIMQRSPKKYSKSLEEYISINIAIGNERRIEKEDFTKSLKASIEPLYQIAYNQGYDLWTSDVGGIRDMKTYNKLVRDKIPAIIEADGKSCEVIIAPKEEMGELLEKKLMEEVNEYIEDKNLEELADVMEVLFGLAHHLGYSEEELLEKRRSKCEERGGFNEGVVLKGVSINEDR